MKRLNIHVRSTRHECRVDITFFIIFFNIYTPLFLLWCIIWRKFQHFRSYYEVWHVSFHLLIETYVSTFFFFLSFFPPWVFVRFILYQREFFSARLIHKWINSAHVVVNPANGGYIIRNEILSVYFIRRRRTVVTPTMETFFENCFSRKLLIIYAWKTCTFTVRS